MVFKYFVALFAARCTVWALDTGNLRYCRVFFPILTIFSFCVITSFALFSAVNRDNLNRFDALDRQFYCLQNPSKRNFSQVAPFGR